MDKMDNAGPPRVNVSDAADRLTPVIAVLAVAGRLAADPATAYHIRNCNALHVLRTAAGEVAGEGGTMPPRKSVGVSTSLFEYACRALATAARVPESHGDAVTDVEGYAYGLRRDGAVQWFAEGAAGLKAARYVLDMMGEDATE